ncbi:unnamed protein product [Paramecium pentaurelia]|uniref:Uncharacterized protein n=1 Tax=Paramecium pentaurelia TaxID=43138 RepID=A0A8S1XX24_9CILI|nr:unnamed protein product [Paramecium pentaurelia]
MIKLVFLSIFDQIIIFFITHEECKAHSSLCKSDGQGCILASTSCVAQNGYLAFCQWALDTNNKSTCAKGTLATIDASCTKLTCELNVTATTDSECSSFHLDCLNKGLGCIHKSEVCSSYYSTIELCWKFTSNGVQCFGDFGSVKAACRNRSCTDLATATSDSECVNFLTGCLFNGVGCVSKSAAYSASKGTQSTCSGFKGSNGTKYCWGASTTAPGNCADRKCSDKVGTTDAECQTFLPSIAPATAQLCITDGKTCLDTGKACSFFKGNDKTCLQFTASDGPCKASSVSASPVTCTPRVCYEARNTYTKDDQCSKYDPNCKATCRGCKSSVGCEELTSQTSCTANTSMGRIMQKFTNYIWWINYLKSNNLCEQYIANLKEIGCRAFTCTDYDGSISTLKDCQDKNHMYYQWNWLYNSRTMFIIQIKSVCESANSDELSLRCTWNSTTAACRQRQCADGVFTTDDACNIWFAGCKTSESACFRPNFGCDVFNGNPKICLKNSAGNPCLYFDGVCYDQDNCTDINSSTYTFCQAFSKQCVPTTTTCRAIITLCDKYEDIFSCTIGINNTQCGWLPESTCKEYTACSDAQGATLSACTSWDPTCVSDGTKCIDKGTCSSYLTPSACDNEGTDGLCQWTRTASTTDAECVAYVVKSGVWTTDGAKFFLRATYSSYQSGAACTIGSDEIPCVFDLPVGATTGTKSCRPKECSDIKGTTNDACVGIIPKKLVFLMELFVLNKIYMPIIRIKLSCKVGGSDGKCAFNLAPTATDPNNGPCQLFKSCMQMVINYYWDYYYNQMLTYGLARNCFSFDCTVGDPFTLTAEKCYKTTTLYSYTWNESTNKCVSCKAPTNNNNNITIPNTTYPGTNTYDNGYILDVTIPLAILGIFI